MPPPSLTLQIHDVGFGGRGVGRMPDGRAAFVPFVLAGETVSVRVLREHRGHVDAGLLGILEPSPHRLPEPAPCPYFGRCGGCAYQHADDAEQLAIKERQVGDVLRRLGRLELADGTLAPIIPSPQSYGYRNRITVHTRDDDGAAGFFTHPWGNPDGRRELLNVTHCPIAEPGVNTALAEFRTRRRRLSGHGDEGHFTLRAVGRRDRRFFQQTNDGAAERLLELVRGLLLGTGDDADANNGHPPRGHLIDAYCGAGFFARPLATSYARVTGLEWDRHAVAAAREGAAAHEHYLAGDVAALLAPALTEASGAETALLLDPPADGLGKGTVEILRASPPAVVVYVSCNPATLARDLSRLLGEPDAPWTLRSVTPLDMFPQTAEIEAVACLQLRR